MKFVQTSILLAAILGASNAFQSVPSLATTKTTGLPIMARSENSRRTENRGRGGPNHYTNGGGDDFDYSGGNLKYGTGKYTQSANDGYQGGVNISRNGRSMQDNVYREDRRNVDRARGRPRNDFGSRMDEIEDFERGMPREGMRDRMMRNRGGMRNANDDYDMDGFSGEFGARDRMGGPGLLRDMQVGRGGQSNYDDFGAPGRVMGGSSHGRGGGYRSNQFANDISNERRRYAEYGHRMDDYMEDGFGDRRRGGRGGRGSNFDRLMGRDGGDYMDREYDDYYMGDYGRGRDRYDDYDDYGRGSGGLLRDMRR